MATKLMRIGFRVAILAAVCVLGFYIGRPLYWKLTATLQDIREKDYTQEAVKQGLSDLVRDAQNSVHWGPGETTEVKSEQEPALKDSEKKAEEPTKSTESDKTLTKEVIKTTEDPADKKTEETKVSKDGSTASRLTRRLLAGY